MPEGDQGLCAVGKCIAVRNYSQPLEEAGIISFKIWPPGGDHSQSRQAAMVSKDLCSQDLHEFHLWEVRKHYNAKRWCINWRWSIDLLYHLLDTNTHINILWLGALAYRVILSSALGIHLLYLQPQSCNMDMLGEMSSLTVLPGQLGNLNKMFFHLNQNYPWSGITACGRNLS